jgi:hypothetical protein
MPGSESYRVRLERSDGTTRTYVLQSKVVTLRGTERKIHYFTREGGEPPAPPEYVIHENMRISLPLDWQITVAREMVRLLGETPQVAAEIAGRLKADLEGLSRQEGDEVVRRIRAALDEE